ncbi:MAG: 50S ribosomal protein L15 [Candidatus Cloacimonetes bacterium]|nr:50S ribosomal protein L15 [Candidatus Cloacimonadota bacterium]MCF7814341.1 50S ribosomal protein L15 [Candidatus Cloacimonadota bacterium]MCF7868967.1 50S ribosomal protein L15 [Candidatus Cloacimonadota bacterium]MCF7884361.1 50S ribosomal protein L15 [Candidatus Cloacimonadota bacterium]
MELHNIERPNVKKNKKRLGKGHGSGTGKTAGRGHKGQKSRSGGSIPAWFEGGQMPLQRRLPKRGFKNIFKKQFRLVNLETLQKIDEAEFDIEKLENLNLIRKAKAGEVAPVKILANGGEEFDKKIVVRANAFSEKAKELIEKSGGTAEVI